MSEIIKSADKLLFTPGPITTSLTVKKAALNDFGPRDPEFISHISEIRDTLLNLAHVDSPEYESVIMQGSGTFGLESVISSVVPSTGMLLNIINGDYGRRISQIARIHSIPLVELIYEEDQLFDYLDIEALLNDNSLITHVAMVHGETTTGIINPIDEISEIAARYNTALIVDAMSTFGAYEIDMKKLGISFLISSSGKCIEGLPGLSFVLAKRTELEKCRNQSRTLSLNLFDQWKGFELNGQFRFTPPVHAVLAFYKALKELHQEGGIKGRSSRYLENNTLLVEEMRKMGFETFLPDHIRGYVITPFFSPGEKNFPFQKFISELNKYGFVIYPGRLKKVDMFSIGNIGHIYPKDIRKLTTAIENVLNEMNIMTVQNALQS